MRASVSGGGPAPWRAVLSSEATPQVHVPSSKTSAGGKRRDDGQALVELALVTPILVLLLMAIFQFAFVLESQMGLTNAVREAARRAAADPSPTEGAVQTQLDALLAANVQGFESGRVAAESVTISDYCLAGENNNRVLVSVTYRHPVFFPLLAYATDLVDGVHDDNWTLTASAQMRLETTQNPGSC
jgi:Flp pilus assembly protein TadG